MKQFYYYPSTRLEKLSKSSTVIVILFGGVCLVNGDISNPYAAYGFKYRVDRVKSTSWVEGKDKYQTHKSKYNGITRILVTKNNKCISYISFNSISGGIISNYIY